MTFKFDGWPRKIIGHLFYTTSSFVHHFKSISEFKLELQSGNTQFRSKWTIFLSRVTFKFYGWSWKIIGHLFHATSSFVHHFIAIGEFKLELQSGNAQFGSKLTIFLAVWPRNLTDDLENNRALLLCYLKLCTSFRSQLWANFIFITSMQNSGIIYSINIQIFTLASFGSPCLTYKSTNKRPTLTHQSLVSKMVIILQMTYLNEFPQWIFL